MYLKMPGLALVVISQLRNFGINGKQKAKLEKDGAGACCWSTNNGIALFNMTLDRSCPMMGC
jgi:hypothetical protein